MGVRSWVRSRTCAAAASSATPRDAISSSENDAEETMTMHRVRIAIGALAATAWAAQAQETTVRVGMVRSISSVATLTAVEKGYFKEAGIKVVTEDLDTSANSIALLAQNQLQIIEGGISAGYFNALEKNLPITMVMDRVSRRIGHNRMLRPDLKGQVTKLSQLKCKVVASNGTGSVSTYEVGKMLETEG